MTRSKALIALTAANIVLTVAVWVGALGSVGSAGPADPEVVRARELQVVNAAGQVVGQVYTGNDGTGQLRLRDAAGTVRVKPGVGQDGGSGLALFDAEPDPQPGVIASTGEKGTRLTLTEPGERRVLRP
jgi:hypothetical protein